MVVRISDMTVADLPLAGDEEIELSIPGSPRLTRRATVQDVADLASVDPGSASIELQPRWGRYLMADGTVVDPMRVGLGVLSVVGSSSTITDDSLYNAWPNAIRMADGRLLMVYTKANGHNTDNSNKVVGKIGVEGLAGAVAWGSEFDIYDHASLAASVYGLSRTKTGRVIVSLARCDNTLSPVRNAEAGVAYSDDNGATWSGWVNVAHGWTQEGFCAGPAVQLSNGDLLVTVEGTNTGDTAINRGLKAVRSTDNGETWGSPVTIRTYAADSRAIYEACLIVLPDESILCIERTDATNVYFQVSTDGGATWGSPYAGPTAVVGHMVMLLTSTDTLIFGGRRVSDFAFVAYASKDWGVTWGSAVVIDSSMVAGSGLMQYACPVELYDGRILWVYGVQPTSSLTNSDIKTIITTETAYRLPTKGVKSIAYASTITPDVKWHSDFRVTLTGNVTVANPTNLYDGAKINLRIKQDGTGSRTAAWGSKWKFPGGTPTLSTAANANDFVTGQYDATDDTIYAAIGKAMS